MSAEPMRLEWLTLPMAPVPLRMLVSLCELIEPLRVVAGQLPESAVPTSAAVTSQLQRGPSLLVSTGRERNANAGRTQDAVQTQPLEELGVRQRARLVLDEGH